MIPLYSGEEVNQTFAILYYAIYHGECLLSPINDTMSASLQKLYSCLCTIRKTAYSGVYNQIPTLDLASMTQLQQLSSIENYIGSYPLPASLTKSSTFLRDIPSIGAILEIMVLDWIALRGAMTNPGEQVIVLRDQVINCLKEVYYSNPEYLFTMEVLTKLKAHGSDLTDSLKNFVQACVVATVLQVDCIDRGLLELICFVRNTDDVFIVDTFKGIADGLFPGNLDCFNTLHHALNDVYITVRKSPEYTITNFEAVLKSPGLVVTSINRSFSAIEYLMRNTTLYQRIRECLLRAKETMNSVSIISSETAKTIVPTAPSTYVEAFNQYEIVNKERSQFLGSPTREMVIRWVTILVGVVKYLSKMNQQSSLLQDTNDLANTLLALIKI